MQSMLRSTTLIWILPFPQSQLVQLRQRFICCSNKGDGPAGLVLQCLAHVHPLFLDSRHPFAFTHQGFAISIFKNAIHIKFARTDHPIHMHQ